MTIGGVHVSEAQFLAMARIVEAGGQISVLRMHSRTGGALVRLGFAEMFVPEANTYAMAARGRVRYYRLTAAGKEAIVGLRRRYDRK
jgi:hypothetical protein